MLREVAQLDGGNNCGWENRREERSSSASNEFKSNSSQDIAAVTMPMASCDDAVTGVSEVLNRARKRRHRRGRNLHKHRLSKHRRARCMKRRIGAPRNDNEYLMSQYSAGLQLRESQGFDPPNHLDNAGSMGQSYLFPVGQVDTSSDQLVSPSRSSSDESNCSSPSDYGSLPSSPSEDSHYHGYRELFLNFQPETGERRDRFVSGCSVVIDGMDANFLRQNFEEEYSNNITRGLEQATREELISKCIVLMDKLKELEGKKFARVATNPSLRDTTMTNILC